MSLQQTLYDLIETGKDAEAEALIAEAKAKGQGEELSAKKQHVPLIAAVYNGQLNVVEALLDCPGVDPNQSNSVNTPLAFALAFLSKDPRGHQYDLRVRILDALLNHPELDVNQGFEVGERSTILPLDIVVADSRLQEGLRLGVPQKQVGFKKLCVKGARQSTWGIANQDKDMEALVLQVNAFVAAHNDQDKLQALLESDSWLLNAVSFESGVTVLMAAIDAGQDDVVTFLAAQEGIDWGIKDSKKTTLVNGKTAVHHARAAGNDGVLGLLVAGVVRSVVDDKENSEDLAEHLERVVATHGITANELKAALTGDGAMTFRVAELAKLHPKQLVFTPVIRQAFPPPKAQGMFAGFFGGTPSPSGADEAGAASGLTVN